MTPTNTPNCLSDRVLIFDTTLRDGEQCPGATMTLEEKLEVADLLDAMGVDIIEAGFPIASNGDFEAVCLIANRVKNATVAGLARAISADITRAGEAVRHAARPRIHTFVSTSPIHLAHQMRKTRRRGAGDHHRHCRAGPQSRRGRRVVGHGCDAHRRSISCAAASRRRSGPAPRPSTCPTRWAMRRPTSTRRCSAPCASACRTADKAIFSTHCHNDLGLAVANSLAALDGGARQVECTINGIGERAGNAALEEIVMAISTRSDVLPYETGIDATMLTRASKLAAAATSFPVQYNKAIVGRNAFAHESGIHQDGMLKYAQTYEIMTPESVGVFKTSLVMGKHSGRNAFRTKLEEMGYDLGRQPARGRLRPVQGSRRPQEACLRRGYRGPGRPEHRHGP